VSREHPHHVTVRVRRGTWNLRSQRCFKRITAAFNKAHERDNFRIVHYAVLGDHLHLLVEADDRGALSNGVRGTLISMARRLNKLMKKRGSLFRDRFHERALMTTSAVRTALRYVLTNAHKHYGHDLVDEYSSGPWFTGWPSDIKRPRRLPCTDPPTRDPTTTLMRSVRTLRVPAPQPA
jgi:REP element-mobilizing transposase RayT